jgi:hypothetical protein
MNSGALAQFPIHVRHCPNKIPGEKWVCYSTAFQWTSLLWGYLKRFVYATSVHDTAQLHTVCRTLVKKLEERQRFINMHNNPCSTTPSSVWRWACSILQTCYFATFGITKDILARLLSSNILKLKRVISPKLNHFRHMFI